MSTINTAQPVRAAARRTRAGVTFEDMAARRAERLVNLVICLLSTRQFLSAERIRDAVPGYEPADGNASTDEAFKRKRKTSTPMRCWQCICGRSRR